MALARTKITVGQTSRHITLETLVTYNSSISDAIQQVTVNNNLFFKLKYGKVKAQDTSQVEPDSKLQVIIM